MDLRDSLDINNPDLHVYSSWTMPELRHLRTENLIPHACLAANLTSFYMSCPIAENVDMVALMAFLESCSQLVRLTVLFFEVKADETALPVIELPMLRKFSLSVYSRPTEECAKNLMLALRMPNLLEMSLDLHVKPRDVDDLYDLLKDMLPLDKEHYSSIQDFRIKVDWSRREKLYSPLDVVGDKIPDVRHLSIDAPPVDVPIPHEAEPWRMLQSLTIENCARFCPDDFGTLLEYLAEGPAWSDLKTIKIKGCPHFQDNCLEERAVGRLIWVDSET